MAKIKIMFLSGALSFGGLERVVINLCTHIDKSKFDPVMVCIKTRGELADEIEAAGIKLYVLESNKGKYSNYFSWLSLRRIVQKENVEIIHSHNTGALFDSVLSTLFSKKTILFHTDHARSFPDKMRYMIAEHIASYFVSEVVAVSDQLKQDLVRYEKIPAKKISVIYNGINGEAYASGAADKQKIKKQLACDHFGQLIGLGVVLTDQKGITHLVNAAPRILEKFPDTGFLVAGDGPCRKELELEVKTLGLSESFVFLGFRRDIADILQVLDIYVFPSEWEGLPLAILEAMAAKRPIVSTDVGGIPNVLTDGKDALLVSPKDPDAISESVTRLLLDPLLRGRLAESAFKTFEKSYNVQAMVEKYEELFFKNYYKKRKLR